MALDVQVDRLAAPRTVIVRLAGVLDYASAPEAQRVLAVVAAESPRVVALDLERLEFLDSTGITVLLAAEIAARKRNASLVMTNVQRPVRKVLDVVRVLPRVPIFFTRAELDAYLAKIQDLEKEKPE